MWTDDWYFERRSRVGGIAKIQQITQDYDYLIQQLREALADDEVVEVRAAADASPEQIEEVGRLAKVA